MGIMLAAGWWGDFIRWLEGHDASALVLAAFLTFLATVILVIVTAFYAKSAGRQAKASVKMAEEMREQRLDEDRSHLLIDLADQAAPDGGHHRFTKGETLHDMCPRLLHVEIRNVGRGPAKDLVAAAVHPGAVFDPERRGYLLKDVLWEFELSHSLGRWIGRRSPRRLSDWLAERGVESAHGIRSPLGVVVEYRDIYERGWISYLELGYESETGDDDDELIWWVEPGKQSTVGPLATRTPPEKGATP